MRWNALRPLRLTVALGFVLLACDGDDEGSPPDPPEMLTAAPLEGGAHLTWVDGSDNETEFMVMRMDVTAGGQYETIATVPFDTTSYHDAPLTSGTTYKYMVMAMNDAGTSDSNEIELTAP